MTYHFALMEGRIAARQAKEAGDLGEHSLEKWSERERTRIEEDPDSFVRSDK